MDLDGGMATEELFLILNKSFWRWGGGVNL